MFSVVAHNKHGKVVFYVVVDISLRVCVVGLVVYVVAFLLSSFVGENTTQTIYILHAQLSQWHSKHSRSSSSSPHKSLITEEEEDDKRD